MSSRCFRHRFAISLTLFLLWIPLAVGAQGLRVIDVLRVPDDASVPRGEFIRAAVKLLDVPLEEHVILPYERPVPRALLPYIGAAYERGALAVFGEDELLQARGITRGEALAVLAGLTGLRDAPVERDRSSEFKDVEAGSPVGRAVNVALEDDWMRPLKPDLFGVRRLLTGKEARLLLSRVVREAVEEAEAQPTVRIIIAPREGIDLPKADILEALWKLLEQHFLYEDKLDPTEAAYKAAEGIVQSVKDPYTTFLRPATSKEFRTQIQGEISGIGTQVEYIDGYLTVVAPLKGSPAERAGIKPADRILAVDGESIVGIGFMEAVEKVRGPRGSIAKLTIDRSGIKIELSVMRDVIRVPEVEVTVQGPHVVVKLHQFGQTTERELRGVLAELNEKGIKGVVLDLRNNPGGLLHAAEVVLSNFLPEGSPVAIIRSKGEREYTELTDDPPTIDPEIPVVVLVNRGSASASEIVAGTLQDLGRAKVVGQKTFGKGTVQQIMEFNDGSSVKITIAEWLTPKERKIDKEGVEPDISVPDPNGGRDEQLLRALELLGR